MEYCLKSNGKILDLYRELFPMDDLARDRIKGSLVLKLEEALLGHYEVNPFLFASLRTYRNSIEHPSFSVTRDAGYTFVQNYLEQLLRNFQIEQKQVKDFPINRYEFFCLRNIHPMILDVKTFIDLVDSVHYGLIDGLRADYPEKINKVTCTSKEEVIKKEIYVQFVANRGLGLPVYITECASAWEPKLSTVSDIKKIDYKDLSNAAIACSGCNFIAQIMKRADPNIQISKVYNSKLMQDFLKQCSKAEGVDSVKAQDTVREYIEHQFK